MGGDHHQHGATEGDVRTKVWSMTRGPNCRPKHWKRNTAIAMFGIFLTCIPIAMISIQLECILGIVEVGYCFSCFATRSISVGAGNESGLKNPKTGSHLKWFLICMMPPIHCNVDNYRRQPSWDRTCTAAAAIGLLAELHTVPSLSTFGLENQAEALENGLDVLLDALTARRLRMGRSITRREKE